jgi:hypothetical protein
MKKHFLRNDTPANRVRYRIFQLMGHFEEMYDLVGALLEFRMHEEKVKNQIEAHLIEMEKEALSMTKELKSIEKNHTDNEQKKFETTTLYEAVRRSYNLLTALNIMDLESPGWVRVTSKCLIEKVYYRQIKSLIFNPE